MVASITVNEIIRKIRVSRDLRCPSTPVAIEELSEFDDIDRAFDYVINVRREWIFALIRAKQPAPYREYIKAIRAYAEFINRGDQNMTAGEAREMMATAHRGYDIYLASLDLAGIIDLLDM